MTLLWCNTAMDIAAAQLRARSQDSILFFPLLPSFPDFLWEGLFSRHSSQMCGDLYKENFISGGCISIWGSSERSNWEKRDSGNHRNRHTDRELQTKKSIRNSRSRVGLWSEIFLSHAYEQTYWTKKISSLSHVCCSSGDFHAHLEREWITTEVVEYMERTLDTKQWGAQKEPGDLWDSCLLLTIGPGLFAHPMSPCWMLFRNNLMKINTDIPTYIRFLGRGARFYLQLLESLLCCSGILPAMTDWFVRVTLGIKCQQFVLCGCWISLWPLWQFPGMYDSLVLAWSALTSLISLWQPQQIPASSLVLAILLITTLKHKVLVSFSLYAFAVSFWSSQLLPLFPF